MSLQCKRQLCPPPSSRAGSPQITEGAVFPLGLLSPTMAAPHVGSEYSPRTAAITASLEP